ncbi:MAG: DUF4258 domain-containing protein [Phycisphaerae bacterium]|nr:DUF4258 domain-containing protein [Phycisphaerae bacterium]
MYERILSRMRRLVLEQQYIVTLHADEEMNADDLTVYDVERAILTGNILERQRDTASSEYKYRLRGRALDGTPMGIVAKISITNKLVFITVYSL